MMVSNSPCYRFEGGGRVHSQSRPSSPFVTKLRAVISMAFEADSMAFFSCTQDREEERLTPSRRLSAPWASRPRRRGGMPRRRAVPSSTVDSCCPGWTRSSRVVSSSPRSCLPVRPRYLVCNRGEPTADPRRSFYRRMVGTHRRRQPAGRRHLQGHEEVHRRGTRGLAPLRSRG